jgi:3-oxoacyl-[acyl-carrier protein] reductase
MFSFKDKTVLVTGGSRGIGAATVKLFAQLGANVAYNYQSNKKAADDLYRAIKSFSGHYFYDVCDVKNFILVNNAGIWEFGAIEKMSVSDWERTISTNLDSVFYFTKLVVSHMKEKEVKGRIIHIASTAGQRGEAFHSHYAATKGGIISFTKSLAAELGPAGISVNCVSPGWVETDMTRDTIRTDGSKILKDFPLKKLPVAEDIAKPIVFLASDWASAINGEILNVNAGSVLCG